jgi:hypothetical protein
MVAPGTPQQLNAVRSISGHGVERSSWSLPTQKTRAHVATLRGTAMGLDDPGGESPALLMSFECDTGRLLLTALNQVENQRSLGE